MAGAVGAEDRPAEAGRQQGGISRHANARRGSF